MYFPCMISLVTNMSPDNFYIFFQAALYIDKVQMKKEKIKQQQEGKGSKNDNILMAFEKFVSTQKVSFFSQQMDISN